MDQLGTIKNNRTIRTIITKEPAPETIVNEKWTASKIASQGVYIDINEVSFFPDYLVSMFNPYRHSRSGSDVELFAGRMGFNSYDEFLGSHIKDNPKLPYVGYWSYYLINEK